MDCHKSKGKVRRGRWIPRREMAPRKRVSKRLPERASTEAMIEGLISCADGRGVCEMCCGDWPLNELTTVWVGQGNLQEGLAICRYCEVKGGE